MGVFSGATRYNKSIIADIVRFQNDFTKTTTTPPTALRKMMWQNFPYCCLIIKHQTERNNFFFFFFKVNFYFRCISL